MVITYLIKGELSDANKKELRNNGNTGDITTQFFMWIYYVNNHRNSEVRSQKSEVRSQKLTPG